ncbi:uncharacterized protein LOC129983685 [Argiope bruennichi]|uniref:uncharacterized protein LOC129983685 n=1 Tax=Argiope bruennichi TaxID=94029 RepID=UPI00249478C3|nr:uncharacterized protein LOC129983685 [Argiope bruennichi]
MFCIIVLACIFLADVHGQVYHDNPYRTRPYQAEYYFRNPHHHQHSEQIRDYTGEVTGQYGYHDYRGIGQQVNYAPTPIVSDRLPIPSYYDVPSYDDPFYGYGL